MAIEQTQSNMHLVRAPRRVTKAEMDTPKMPPGSSMALPGLHKERHQMYQERLEALHKKLELVPPVRITNATMRSTKPYATGDGDPFHQTARPGSMHAFTLPSRGHRT
jgi:hypothetical protein